jgi:hypothetical protein
VDIPVTASVRIPAATAPNGYYFRGRKTTTRKFFATCVLTITWNHFFANVHKSPFFFVINATITVYNQSNTTFPI